MTKEELLERTKSFALRIIKLVESLPNTTTGRAIGNQLIRSGTSVASNYRAACRGRSKPEFIAKLGVVIEEADESLFWLELIIESNLKPKEMLEPLLKETDELLRIFIATRKTAIANHKSKI